MKYAVSVLHRAQDDADRIFEWIAARSQQGALSWHRAFEEALVELEAAAEQFGIAPESNDIGILVRQKLFKTRRGRTHRLLYLVDGRQVRVLRVRGPGQPPVTTADVRE